jgi:nucleotide-binding universal stress UspA family protein
MKTEMLPIKSPKLPGSHGIPVVKTTHSSLKIKNVLVPLDFSPASYAALRFALPLQRHFSANLHLVHVLPAHSPLSGLADLPMVAPDVEIGRRVQRDLAESAQKHGAVTQSGNLHVRRGRTYTEICSLARQANIDLIVISTQGNTGLKHLALGSTAERVVRYSPCPVLVVRDAPQADKGSNGKAPPRTSAIGRILVPTDFSECSMKGLAYAKQLANEFGARLILLHSVPIRYFVGGHEYARYDFPLLMQQSERVAQKQMRSLIANTQRKGVKVEHSIEIGHAGQQICARAEAEQADIIVASTHGRTGLKHILMGSTAEYVVRHAQCPVLVVPSHERPAIHAAKG